MMMAVTSLMLFLLPLLPNKTSVNSVSELSDHLEITWLVTEPCGLETTRICDIDQSTQLSLIETDNLVNPQQRKKNYLPSSINNCLKQKLIHPVISKVLIISSKYLIKRIFKISHFLGVLGFWGILDKRNKQ